VGRRRACKRSKRAGLSRPRQTSLPTAIGYHQEAGPPSGNVYFRAREGV
jgi:hypothetical protein